MIIDDPHWLITIDPQLCSISAGDDTFLLKFNTNAIIYKMFMYVHKYYYVR